MKAAIFDMDGTLLDSMSQWRRLNVEFIRQRGIEPTEEEAVELTQLSGIKAVRYFQEHFGMDCDYDEISDIACRAMEKVYAAGVPEKPGAAAYLRRLGERGSCAWSPRRRLRAMHSSGSTTRASRRTATSSTARR